MLAHVIEVRSVTTNDAPNDNDAVNFVVLEKTSRGVHEFDGSGHMHHGMVVGRITGTLKKTQRTLEQSIGHFTVPARHHNSQLQTIGYGQIIDIVLSERMV